MHLFTNFQLLRLNVTYKCAFTIIVRRSMFNVILAVGYFFPRSQSLVPAHAVEEMAINAIRVGFQSVVV